MEYFWTHQYDLPSGTGYAHGSLTHILSVAALAAGVIVCLHRPAGTKAKMIKTIPILLLIMEIGKDLYLRRTGYFGVGYLPLHLCSMGIPVFLLAVYGGRWKCFFIEIAMILILPGSVCAILFPDWNMYPVWNFMNLYSWVWHGLLVLFPLLIRYRWKADIRNIWKPTLFLVVVVPLIYIFDRKFDCNYLFINWPPEGTPLQWLVGIMGVPGYLTGYAALTLLVMVVVYCLYGIRSGSKGD